MNMQNFNAKQLNRRKETKIPLSNLSLWGRYCAVSSGSAFTSILLAKSFLAALMKPFSGSALVSISTTLRRLDPALALVKCLPMLRTMAFVALSTGYLKSPQLRAGMATEVIFLFSAICKISFTVFAKVSFSPFTMKKYYHN